MDNERTLRGSVLTVARRFAAGIDVSEDAVRVAIISRRIRPVSPTVCVNWLECVALPEGAVVNGDFVDRTAVAAAIREAFGRLPASGPWRSLRCAIGLASATTVTASVPLMQLIETHEARMALDGGDPFGMLEPVVLAQAERVTGIERGGLAVDWSVQTRDNARTHVSIVATARRHVEARVECASMAGVALAAIDGEPAAALRAMRHAAETALDADARYLVCWLERSGLHAWLIDAGDVDGEVRYPAPEYRSIAEALRDLAGGHAPVERIYLGGDVGLMEGAGQSPHALAKLFSCPVEEFRSAPYCGGTDGGGIDIPGEHRQSPRFAVAFGLALREVMQ
jgi:Tfp pilus assembly PilM family ATPase